MTKTFNKWAGFSQVLSNLCKRFAQLSDNEFGESSSDDMRLAIIETALDTPLRSAPDGVLSFKGVTDDSELVTLFHASIKWAQSERISMKDLNNKWMEILIDYHEETVSQPGILVKEAYPYPQQEPDANPVTATAVLNDVIGEFTNYVNATLEPATGCLPFLRPVREKLITIALDSPFGSEITGHVPFRREIDMVFRLMAKRMEEHGVDSYTFGKHWVEACSRVYNPAVMVVNAAPAAEPAPAPKAKPIVNAPPRVHDPREEDKKNLFNYTLPMHATAVMDQVVSRLQDEIATLLKNQPDSTFHTEENVAVFRKIILSAALNTPLGCNIDPWKRHVEEINMVWNFMVIRAHNAGLHPTVFADRWVSAASKSRMPGREGLAPDLEKKSDEYLQRLLAFNDAPGLHAILEDVFDRVFGKATQLGMNPQMFVGQWITIANAAQRRHAIARQTNPAWQPGQQGNPAFISRMFDPNFQRPINQWWATPPAFGYTGGFGFGELGGDAYTYKPPFGWKEGMPDVSAVKNADDLRKAFLAVELDEHPMHTRAIWQQAIVAKKSDEGYWDWLLTYLI